MWAGQTKFPGSVWRASPTLPGQIIALRGKEPACGTQHKVSQWKAFIFFCCPNDLELTSRTHSQFLFFNYFLENNSKLIFSPLKITRTANDWFTGFLFGLILIIVGRRIELRLVVLVRCCVLTITSLMIRLWSETDGNVLLCYVMLWICPTFCPIIS